nr:PRC-barrel domain-containing protein [Bradyrhizobium elkanii]
MPACFTSRSILPASTSSTGRSPSGLTSTTKESKIGTIDDVLVDKSAKVTGLVVGVGGFLGAGEKDVIVPFTAVKETSYEEIGYRLA